METVGYETDPELQSPKLKVLQDSEGFFPDYDAVPAVSTEALLRIAGLLNWFALSRSCNIEAGIRPWYAN